jgi:ketosteroid isomerase-like protein
MHQHPLSHYVRAPFAVSLIAVAMATWPIMPLPGDGDDRQANVAELAQAERDFAKLCVEKGFALSFSQNFADDGLGFWPEPLKVRAEILKEPLPPPVPAGKPRPVLDWYPVLSDIAASGEMGFNTGPSVNTPPAGSPNKPRYGNFFSVWKKQADGQFKVVLDMGADTETALAADTAASWRALKIEPWEASSTIAIDKEVDQLKRQEAALNDAIASKGPVAAYGGLRAADFRFLENGHQPLIDKATADAHLQKIGPRAQRRFEPRLVDVAKSADIGYSWGAYTAGAEKGYYGHYWRRDAQGRWRLVVEVIRPLPPAKS